MESLVSDILPGGTGRPLTFFYSVSPEFNSRLSKKRSHRLDVLFALLSGLLVGDELVAVHGDRRFALSTVCRLLLKWLTQPDHRWGWNENFFDDKWFSRNHEQERRKCVCQNDKNLIIFVKIFSKTERVRRCLDDIHKNFWENEYFCSNEILPISHFRENGKFIFVLTLDTVHTFLFLYHRAKHLYKEGLFGWALSTS